MLILGFFTWLGFAGLAVGAGIFRVLWLQPRLGEFAANLVETLGLVVILAVAIRVAVPWLDPALEKRSLIRLGLFWMLLTLAFEFLFGHFVDRASWSALLSNYNVAQGRLWILVPLTLLLEPVLIGSMRGFQPGTSPRGRQRRTGRLASAARPGGSRGA